MTKWLNAPILTLPPYFPSSLLPYLLFFCALIITRTYSAVIATSADLHLLDLHRPRRENAPMTDASFQPGQMVRVNLAGIQVQGVLFHAAVTDAVGHIVRQTSDSPPKFLVKLLFSFRGVSEVEVPAERIRPA